MKKNLVELVKFFAVLAIMTVLVVGLGASVMRLAVVIGLVREANLSDWEYRLNFPERATPVPKKDPGDFRVTNPETPGEVVLWAKPQRYVSADPGDPWDLEPYDYVANEGSVHAYAADSDGCWDVAPRAYSDPEDCNPDGSTQDEEVNTINDAMTYNYHPAEFVSDVPKDPAIADQPVNDGFFDFETGRVYLLESEDRRERLPWPEFTISDLRVELLWLRQQNQMAN